MTPHPFHDAWTRTEIRVDVTPLAIVAAALLAVALFLLL